MEKARVRRQRQQFQAQFNIQSRELRDALAAQLSDGATSHRNAVIQTRFVLNFQYKLGLLCAEYDEFGLASMYFQQIVTSLEAERPTRQLSVEEAEELMALRTNTLNWLAVTHFRAGNQVEAMNYLLQAKKCSRDECTAAKASDLPVNKLLTVNCALFLHAKGSLVDAEQAAQLVVNEDQAGPSEESEEDTRARSTAFMLLASICKARGDAARAFKYAERAVSLADTVQDLRLVSRAHNNLGVYRLAQGDLKSALSLFASAHRATQQTKDFEQQAIVKYHLGLTLSYLGRNLDINDDEDEKNEQMQQKLQEIMENTTETVVDDEVTTKSSIPEPVSTTKTPKDLFLASDELTSALSEPDEALRVLTQSCRGEEEYYAGEFHTAQATFTRALDQLSESTSIDQEETVLASELAKLHGFLLSHTGCTQLVYGDFTLAEHSYKRDLILALEQEDLEAQHRATRNLALVYTATQRYVDAIPLWREALEVAVVLDLKRDQLMAYSGLGSALRELLLLKGPEAADIAGFNSSTGPMQPLQVFIKQRALAEQIGDLQEQILAQQQIVSVYESPVLKPQSESEASETLERRLSECDALVQLCERYENLQHRTDAYRSLANALTCQLARLRARAKGDGMSPYYGLVDAIAVLSHKRNSVCTSYEEAVIALKCQDVSAQGLEDESKLKPEEHHARPLTRVEILHRPSRSGKMKCNL